MDHETWQVDQFEHHRSHLRAVAYRMLGSVTDADDAVQEAWLRFNRAEEDGIDNLGGWLTTVVGRVCIDMLRARKSRREDYVGTWLPEPVITVDEESDPERQTLLADSVGLALLVVLETLSPPERLAFVLHDMFAVPFDEIAPIVDRSPESARQLASRARRRVRGAAPEPDPDLQRQHEIVAAFLAASRAGDFEALMELLDPDVVFRADAGRRRIGMVTPRIEGAPAVADYALSRGRAFLPWCRTATVNGGPGYVVRPPGRTIGVAAVTIVDGRIRFIDLILDPAKLTAVR
ncbi:MAG TPA: RNA polymerase sigma factor SigJ [Solirubrobacteraceae bacterium]|nr:RNA polymerase sigma factor SigJ [Solirubrobacteraceae bacterium]